MSTKKFNDAEEKYKKTKQWKFICYMYRQASSYDDFKKVVQYIIDSGMYEPGMPKDVTNYERQERWIVKSKFLLLGDVLNQYRVNCKTEQQLLEYINLSLANDLWRAYHSYHIGKAPDSNAIQELVAVATTFDAFYFLYLYNYYDTKQTRYYLQKLKELAITPEQIQKIKDATGLLTEKVEWLNDMD